MKTLAISVHPDDETLGCGGTLLRHADRGDENNWLIITRTSSPDWPAEVVEEKEREIARVSAAYSMHQIHRLDFSPKKLDQANFSELLNGLRAAIEKTRPEVVYLVHRGDVHTDHTVAFRATMSVLKSFYMKAFGVRRIYSYETLSSTEAAAPDQASAFVPSSYVDITPYMEEKIRIMGLFATESQDELFPRGASAIRALGRYRGASVGIEYAEALKLIREVDFLDR